MVEENLELAQVALNSLCKEVQNFYFNIKIGAFHILGKGGHY
jgi:hypothetical protein